MADEVKELKCETEQLKRQLAAEKAKVAEQQKDLVQQASLMKDASDAKPVKKKAKGVPVKLDEFSKEVLRTLKEITFRDHKFVQNEKEEKLFMKLIIRDMDYKVAIGDDAFAEWLKAFGALGKALGRLQSALETLLKPPKPSGGSTESLWVPSKASETLSNDLKRHWRFLQSG